MRSQNTAKKWLLSSTWAVINMTATAAAWQLASEYTDSYGLKMLATGSAEAVVTSFLGIFELQYSFWEAKTDDRRSSRTRIKEIILKPAVISFILGALWQPMVDLGAVLASATHQNNNVYQTSAFSIFTLSVLYGACLKALQCCAELKKPLLATAVLSEVFFYLNGPLNLSSVGGSASGQRDVMWSAILAFGGAISGELLSAVWVYCLRTHSEAFCHRCASARGGHSDREERTPLVSAV